MQDDVSGLQLAFVVKHHGVDPSYGVVLDHSERNSDISDQYKDAICGEEERLLKHVSYHFSCFADGLVLVNMSIFGGLLLLDLIHDSIDGKAEAGHAR